MARCWILLLASATFATLGIAACGPGSSGESTMCPSAQFSATVSAVSPGSGDLHLSGSSGCDNEKLEVLLIEVPTADAALGPSIRDGAYAVVWSTGQATFDHTITFDHLVALPNGETADAGEGHWVLGVRQGGTINAQPLPDNF